MDPMSENTRSLHPVPEGDEDNAPALSPASSRRSGLSPRSPTASSNPFSTNLFRRSGYQRMPSDGAQEMMDFAGGGSSDIDGLGISNHNHRNSISRVPVGSKTTPPETPRSFHGLLGSPNPSDIASPNRSQFEPQARLNMDGSGSLASPPPVRSTGPKSGAFTELWDAPPSNRDQPSPQPPYDDARGMRGHGPNNGTNNSTPMLNYGSQGSPGDLDSRVDFPDEEFDDEIFYKKFSEPPSYCYSKNDIHQHRWSWLSVTIYILSIYSTVMSGIWLVTAIVQPRWGARISSKRGLLPSNATLIAALIAKTIELSFVTVFISCLGQVLTRRSLIRKAGGMTLAEMTMRNWVIQPGTLITHFETLPYAAMTILGALTLTATVAATFYTTASDAMVSPKLKYGNWESKELKGYVRSSYGNSQYVRSACPSLLDDHDWQYADESCISVQLSGESYRNLLGFMTTWTNINENGTSQLSHLAQRPAGTTLLYDNTTMSSAWIETEHSNVTANFEKYSRIINNVTLALPHPGVYTAATSKVNGILQPDDLAGVGEYAIKAGVVSPAINVMCVNMSPEELEPLVYTAWKYARSNRTDVGDQVRGHDGWGGEVPQPTNEKGEANWLNRTVVDDIFEWGPEYERRPPVFQMYPADFNLLTNGSVFESDAIYMLGKTVNFANYTLCQLRSWVSPNCSTEFHISGTVGASMKAHCEDPNDENSYLRSFDTNKEWAKPSKDWRWLADQWRLSMDLNGGAANNNASNARILTQLALKQSSLPTYLPSMAEAIAVYASALEVISAIDTPFRHYWDYTKPGNIIGEPGILHPFNASIITQEYTSGHSNDWQNIFYVVLVLVFGINVFCLVYFIMRSGLVTDFTEPQNLFALAVNSPPSAQLKGSCGGGPEKRDLVVPWRVSYAPSAHHYFFQEASEKPWRGKYSKESASTARDYGQVKGSSYKRLSTSRTWL